MTSHYSSTLLHEAPAPRAVPAPAPRPMVPMARPAVPMPMYAPAPPVIVRRPAGSRLENMLLVLAAIVIAAGVAFAAYTMARNSAPTVHEQAAYQNIARATAFERSRLLAREEGRAYTMASQARLERLKARIAYQREFNRAYRIGQRQGMGMYRNRGYGGYRGTGYRPYRGYRYSNPNAGVGSAMVAAQSLANATGAPVDVEIYN